MNPLEGGFHVLCYPLLQHAGLAEHTRGAEMLSVDNPR
jgi:hypothetical protein